MARLSFRLDEALQDRLLAAADAAGMTPSAYIREMLEQLDGTDPFGFHARFNELQSTIIQVLAILASDVGARSPDVLSKGMQDTHRLLRERGLSANGDHPQLGGGPRA